VRLENLTISGGARNGIQYAYSNANTVENFIVEDNATNGLDIGRASIVRIFNSEIAGGTSNGVQVVASSRVELTDTKVTRGAFRSLSARNHSTIIMTGGELDGRVWIREKSILHLFGVDQTDLGGVRPNSIDDNSQLRTDCTDPSGACNQTRLLDTRLRDFSNASFAESTLDDLTCSEGSDAVCDGVSTPMTAGDPTGCPLCP
jgi:hypothetical protein